MTRKDYQLIAKALRESSIGQNLQDVQQWQVCVLNISDALQAENPRFDRAKFLEACDV